MWFLFAILTTLIWGTAELFYKKGARPDEKYAHLKICICVGAVMGLHAFIIMAISGFDYDFHNLLLYLPVSLCYIISMAFSFFGMRFIEESISDPIENTSGAICALLCVIILKEKLSPLVMIGIGIIVIGILGVGFLESDKDSNRQKKLGKKMAVIAFAMPFLYALLDALGSFLDIYYLEMETSPLVNVTEETIENAANTSYELTFLLCAIILFIFLKIKRVPFNLPKQRDKIIAAVCETAGQFTYVYAMSDNGAISAPIISSGCIVSVLLSRIFLKEKLTVKQYIFVGIVIVGIVILAIMDV